jgi:putative Ca2+/H+ antiporter (TMEM165/GDT1 family)
MSWGAFWTTFAAIFIAELGDKTQLATLSMSTGPVSRWSVFAGSALALVTCSAIAVLAGDTIARIVSPTWLQRGAGLLFLVIGIWTLWPKA